MHEARGVWVDTSVYVEKNRILVGFVGLGFRAYVLASKVADTRPSEMVGLRLRAL